MKRLMVLMVMLFCMCGNAWGLSTERSGLIYYPTDGASAIAINSAIESRGYPATIKFTFDGSGVSKAYVLPSGVTFSELVTLEFENGAMLDIDTDITASVEGQIIAGRNQIKTGDGTLSYEGVVYPEWVYSGTGTYETAFEEIVKSNRDVVLETGKIYEMVDDGGRTLVNGKDHFTISGAGILKVANGVTNCNVLYFTNCDDFDLLDFEIDGNIANGTDNPSGDRAGINIWDGCERVNISRLNIHDLNSGLQQSNSAGINSRLCNDIHLSDSRIVNTDASFANWANTGVVVDNCIIYGGWSESIWFGASSTTSLVNSDITISNCHLDKQLQIQHADTFTVTGCSLSGLNIGGEGGTSVADYCKASNGVVTGNTIRRIIMGSDNTGSTMATAENIVIDGNIIYADVGPNLDMNVPSSLISSNYKSVNVKISNNQIHPTLDLDSSVITMIGVSDLEIYNNTIFDYGTTIGQHFISCPSDTYPIKINYNRCFGGDSNYISCLASNLGPESQMIGNYIPEGRIYIPNSVSGKMMLFDNYTAISDDTNIIGAASTSGVTLELDYAFSEDCTKWRVGSGVTTVTNITHTRPNHEIVLYIQGSGTVFTDGTGNIELSGGADFTPGGPATLTLLNDGTDWRETGRVVF